MVDQERERFPLLAAAASPISMWPKASVGFSLLSHAPKFVLDAFNNVSTLQQELMFCWSIERFWPLLIKCRENTDQVSSIWRRGPHEFFESCRVGITWKW